jgi:hypothetical protein
MFPKEPTPVHLAEAVQAPNVKLGATAGDQPLHLGTWQRKGGPYPTPLKKHGVKVSWDDDIPN